MIHAIAPQIFIAAVAEQPDSHASASLIIPALVAGAFALGGSLLGAYLGRSNEHKQWLRNEKMQAYREFLSTFGLAQIQHFFTILGSDAGDGNEPTHTFEAFRQLTDVCFRVIVVAPMEIADLAQETMEGLLEIQGLANDLPDVLGRKYLRTDQTTDEREEANNQLVQEAQQTISDALEAHLAATTKTLERMINMVRADIRVSGKLGRGYKEDNDDSDN